MELPLGLELDLIDGMKLTPKKRINGRNSPTQFQNEESSGNSETEADKEKGKVAESSEKNGKDRGPKESELKQLVEAVFDH